ncbi:YhgE/Pip domain-containing protein [Microbacterium sp. 10M-3C3]|jgi:putative membrane protein|uniref:YhgE/Pip domain-containing protein n=1 Tax=Microbacterium sp. 10M-3C3 TaxID=2483401 RepID=UPI000F62E18F|nr:YhgE/Pip domain-containing protein [Microbacterium sp. 10M-3C3]
MTALLERAASRRPITWTTIVGAILLPVLIGGLLVAALYNPVERLDNVHAAVVNDDEPVQVNGQTVPLGRQLTAGLVEGSDDLPSNLSWTITNDEDAEAGLADGTYSAVITIPKNFSAAATSTAPGKTPEQATIEVTTSPDALVVDDAISAQVTQAAASLLGQSLSKVYLENVFLGFTTLGDQLGTAADGATQLADGARQAADGATSLADGVAQLGTGAGQLSSGATQLSGGARQLASGAGQLSSGAAQAADGLDQWAVGAQTLAGQGRQLAAGLGTIAGQLDQSQFPTISDDVVTAAQQLQARSGEVNAGLSQAADALAQAAASCASSGLPAETCADIAKASTAVNDNLAGAQNLVSNAGTVATGLQQLPQLGPGLQTIADNLTKFSGGVDQLANGATTAAGGVRQLSTGAAGLATGANQLASGASGLASGASQLATGADQASAGASSLAGGVGQVADGTDSLASGLQQAVDQLPSYTDQQAQSLASVVADPVAAKGLDTNLFGASAVPLLAAVALWFGGLGTFVVLRAVTARALSSRRPSVLLALRGFAPAAAIGAVQGILVAGVVQLAADYDWADWSLFAVVAMVAGVAFAAVNQALVALFGGAGRWVSAIIGVLAVATGVVSTVPGVISAVAGLMPTSPAYTGMLAALTTAGGYGAAIAGLVVWALLALIVTTIAVARRRSASARELLAPSPA